MAYEDVADAFSSHLKTGENTDVANAFAKHLEGVPSKPSYLEAAKVGLKEGLAGAMRMYEIPSRTILEKTGLAAPSTFASELLKPSEEEQKRVGELGIPGEVVRGVSGLPGAFAKYGPMMAAAPAGVVGTAATFAGERAAEELAAGKKPSALQLGEEAAIGGIFRGIEPLGRLARMAILSGTFSTQAFTDTYAQTKDIKQALKAGIAPGVIGAGMGFMGGKREARPIPEPRPEPITDPTRLLPYKPPELEWWRGAGAKGVRGIPTPEGPLALPPGQGFTMTEPPSKPILRPPVPGKGMAVDISPTGEPIYPIRGMPGPPKMPEIPEAPRGPEIPPEPPPIAPTMAPEAQMPPPPAPTPPSPVKAPKPSVKPLADKQMGVIRREAEKAGGLSIDLIKRWSGVGTKRANATLESMVQSGEVEGAEPGQPYPWRLKTPAEDPELTGTIRELNGIIKIGQPSGVLLEGEGRYGSSQAVEKVIGMKGVTRKQALAAIDKGLNGEKLGVNEKRIFGSVTENAKGIMADRKAQDELDRARAEIAKPEDLTKHIDDEIMGLKEELNETYSNAAVSRAIEEATKDLPPEGPPPDIAAIEREVRSLLAPKVTEPALSPTAKDQFALPGIKQGLEMKGAKEGAAPTLEGTPLGEAALKAEREKVQGKLPFVIGDSVVGDTPKGDFKGVVAEVNPDGSVMIGSPDGKMIELPADKVSGVGLKLAVKAGDQAPITGLEEYMTAQGVSVENIPKELLGRADPKDVKVGYVDTEGNFTEIPKPAPEPPPTEKPPEGKPEARTGEAPQEPLSRESVKGFADERLKILKNAPETEILDTIADIPERLSNQLNDNMRDGVKGVYDPVSKKIYLVREMLGSEEDVLRTIEHEAVGHYAAEAYLGKEADPFYNRVYLKFGRAGLKDIADERGFDLNTRDGRINAAKEKVAQLAETGENPGLLKQLYVWIRTQISKVFPDVKITDAEIQRVISNARQSLISGEFVVREAKIETLKKQILAVSGLAPEERFSPAQFSIAGKAKEVGKAGYEEEVKPTAEGIKKGWDRLVNLISPTTGVPLKNMDLMSKFLGEREMARNTVELKTEAGVNALNKLSPQEQIDFIDKIQMGYTFNELPENLREYARTHRAIEDSIWMKANDVLSEMDEPGRISYLDGHVKNIWKVVPRGLMEEIQRRGFKGLSRVPIEGTRAPLHHQYWTLKEGMANGGVPFTTNLMEITRLNHADTMKLLTAHDMWNAFGETGLRKFTKFGEVTPEGFRPLNDRIANKYFPPKEGGRWVVEENVGRLLENYLSRDLVRENPITKGIMAVKNVTTAFELGFSGFHAAFISFEAAASQIGLGMRMIWNQGMIEKGLKEILTAPKAGYDLFKTGNDWYRLMKTPEEFIKTTRGEKFMKMFPEAQEDIGWLFWGGGTMRMSESYRINSINTFRENINSKNYIGAFLRSVPASAQLIMKPLFETYIPALKRAQFLKEFNFRKIDQATDLLSGKTTKAELARNVWKSVENRFGEMNFDNLWWNRTFKSGLQMLVRSVTWKLGNIREYGKGVVGQSAELLSALKEGRMPKLTQEMAWMWGVASLTAAMASITQYAFTGKSPENWKDLVYPQIDNQGGRLSLPTYARDFFSATHSPLKYIGSSMAGWFGRFNDIVNNKDFYGVQVHDPTENVVQQRIDDLIHLAPLPFSIQSMKRMREEGQTPTRQMAGFLGATKAPYWIERSDAEQKASDLKAAHLPMGGRTTADFERGTLIKNYARRYQEASLKGDPTDDIMRELHGDIAAAKLHMGDLMKFRQRITKEPLVNSVMNLPFKDILEVWNVATTEEKKKLYPILNRKYYGLRSPEDRALYMPKIRQIAEEMRQ